MAWFSDHWPEGLAWPADIPRPQPAVRKVREVEVEKPVAEDVA